MENKEKLNQNPEATEDKLQEENSSTTNEVVDQVAKESTDVKAETADGDMNDVKEEVKEEAPAEIVAAQIETPVVAVVETPAATVVSETKEEVAVEEVASAPEKVETPVEAIVETPDTTVVSETKEAVAVEEVASVPEKVETPVEAVVEEAPVKVEAEGKKTEEVTEVTSEEADDSEEEDADEHEEEEEEEVSEETYAALNLEDLALAFEVVLQADNIKNTKNKVGYIRLNFGKKLQELKAELEEKFVAAGGVKEEYKAEPIELEARFNRAFGQYKRMRRKLRQEQDVVMQENLVKKNELLEEIRTLVGSDETLKETYDKFNEIQIRWKAIGMVPKTDIQILWNNYHFLVEKFFDKVKINKELRDLDLKKNLEAKLALCEKAEELLIEESLNKSFKLLQEYHNEWKAIGPVPSSHNDEIWERFKTASDKLNERRKEHYEQLQSKLEENYAAKQALCVKAEELVLKPVDNNKEWTKRTTEIDDLLKVWKTFGPAPRKVNDEIWATFKGYLNQFYDAKKKFFSGMKAEQQENYHKKLDLVQQAEALKDSVDWNSATKTLINLQKEWKNIGPVSRKQSDEIWKKFRAANDFFFDAKGKHFKGQFAEEEENLKVKQALIAEINAAEYSEDKKENLEKIKAFQRRWTDVGNVPKKEMDKLYKAYRGAVDEQLNKLDISSVDFRNAGFRDRIDDYKKKDDDYGLRKERHGLQSAMDKLKEDVLLWENNMGFFRNSKNADVLKLEFEKKIQKAKAEVLVLKEKIRMIDK